MKSLPLQMQQNLILAATLIAGVVFAPQNIEKPLTEVKYKVTRTARAESAYGTASSFSRRPENRSGYPLEAEVLTNPSEATRKFDSRGSSTGHVPLAVQGDWHWTGNDSSSRFRFEPNGRYVYQYSVYQSSRGRRIESTTIEGGTVSFHTDGTFVMKADQGHFQGNTGDGYVNRDMDPDELGERTFYWGLRGNSGMPQLLLGPSAESAHVYTSASIA